MDAQQRWQDSEERGRQFENVSEHDDRAPYRERDGGQRGEWQQGEWQQGERQQNRWQQDEDGGHGLSTALGWLSIGLGLAQIAQPRRVAQIIGVQDDSDTRAVIRAVGVREIATGIGLLAQPQNPGWLKARVGGDAMDLALLGAALNSDDAEKEKVMMATLAVLGVSALDLWSHQQLSSSDGRMMASRSWMPMGRIEQRHNGRRHERWIEPEGRSRQQEHRRPQGIHVKKSITINRPPEEIYSFWRDFRNLPRVMSHLESVEVTGDRESHWVAKAPAGMKVEWDAIITDDKPNELIAWRSVEGAEVQNSGIVRFQPAPGGRGTEIQVELQYNPPGGRLGGMIAKLFGEAPEQQIEEDLRRFKQLMETGVIIESDASIQGRHLAQQPAHPPKDEPM